MDLAELRKLCKTGTRVRYIPGHAFGDRNHPDCEDGAVSSIGEQNVFVRFDGKVSRHGWDGATSEACDPETIEVL